MPQGVLLRLLALIGGALAVILTVKDWHPAVYDLTKITLCASSIGFGLLAMKQKQTPFIWGFYILAVLFNPVLPIRMDQVAWIAINILAAVFFSWRALSPMGRFLTLMRLFFKMAFAFLALKLRQIVCISFKTRDRAVNVILCVFFGGVMAVAFLVEYFEKEEANPKQVKSFDDELLKESSLEIERIFHEEAEVEKRERIQEMNKRYGEWPKTQETEAEERRRLAEKENSH